MTFSVRNSVQKAKLLNDPIGGAGQIRHLLLP
jgi:hypothetical protein